MRNTKRNNMNIPAYFKPPVFPSSSSRRNGTKPHTERRATPIALTHPFLAPIRIKPVDLEGSSDGTETPTPPLPITRIHPPQRSQSLGNLGRGGSSLRQSRHRKVVDIPGSDAMAAGPGTESPSHIGTVVGVSQCPRYAGHLDPWREVYLGDGSGRLQW